MEKEKHTSLEAKGLLLESATFNAHLDPYPEWIQKNKREAWERFCQLPQPTHQSTHWRFSKNTAFAALSGQTYTLSSPNLHGVGDSPTEIMKWEGTRILFCNGRLVQTKTGSLDPSVHIECFAPNAIGYLWEELCGGQEPALDSSKLYALHRAYQDHGVVIRIQGVAQQPIVIESDITQSQGAFFPKIRVIAEPGSRATLIAINHYAKEADGAFVCGHTDFEIAPDAQLTYYTLRKQEAADSVHLQMETFRLKERSQFFRVSLAEGGGYARHEIETALQGEEARAEVYAAGCIEGDHEWDTRILQKHTAPHTYSNFLAKNVLRQKAHAICAGMLDIAAGASNSEAHQKSDHLVLSPEAKATVWPALQVQNNEVQCSHGAVVHPLDRESLFYFQSRGISLPAAEKILADGFMDTISDKTGDYAPTFREALLRKA